MALATFTLAVAVGGIVLANSSTGALIRSPRGSDPLSARVETREAFRLANAKLYADQINNRLIVSPFTRIGDFLSGAVDRQVIDRGFTGIGGLVRVRARLRGCKRDTSVPICLPC